MNFTNRIHMKIAKLTRLKGELETELDNIEGYDAEAGADVRWSIITLSRAILGLQKTKKHNSS